VALDVDPDWESINKRNRVKKENRSNGGLSVEQLHAGHLQLAMVTRNPDCIERGGEDATKGENDAELRGRLDACIACGDRVILGHHADA